MRTNMISRTDLFENLARWSLKILSLNFGSCCHVWEVVTACYTFYKLAYLIPLRDQNTCQTKSPFSPHVALVSLHLLLKPAFCSVAFQKKQRKFLTSFMKTVTHPQSVYCTTLQLIRSGKQYPCSIRTRFCITAAAEWRHYDCRKSWRTFFKWTDRNS